MQDYLEVLVHDKKMISEKKNFGFMPPPLVTWSLKFFIFRLFSRFSGQNFRNIYATVMVLVSMDTEK